MSFGLPPLVRSGIFSLFMSFREAELTVCRVFRPLFPEKELLDRSAKHMAQSFEVLQ